MENILTSRQNSQVKYIKSLGMAKFRAEENKYIIEGVRFIEEALASGVEPELMVFSEKIGESERGAALRDKALDSEQKYIMVSQDILEYVSQTQNPQGVLAVINFPEKKPLPSDFGAGDLFLLVDGIQDPGNLGTIIRTADAAGVSGIILSVGNPDLYNPKVLRATMGSLYHLPVWQDVDAVSFINQAKGKLQVVAGHLGATEPYYDIDYTKATLLIVGNEARGPQPEVLDQAELLVKIPMAGQAESLNVSTATGILLFEAVRQKAKNDLLSL